jgi:hypothetical protein
MRRLTSATEAPGQATIEFQAFRKATKRDQLQVAVEQTRLLMIWGLRIPFKCLA